MENCSDYENYLIRAATVLAVIPKGRVDESEIGAVRLFDVRTGVELREIHPPLGPADLSRGHQIPQEFAISILKSGAPLGVDPGRDASKVVPLLDMRQRKLDSVVAASVLDQVRIIRDLLQDILNVAETTQPEERFWLSQQLLAFIRKFSGRELSEIEEIIEWLRQGHRT